MGLTNDERSSLVELRLEKAKRFIAEAEQMLSMGLWDLAANRFYYSCFHAAQALLIHYGLSAHTHAGTLGVFGMNFVKTGKIDKELGAFFSRMEQLRMKADYNCEYDVSNSDVENMLQPAHDFLNSHHQTYQRKTIEVKTTWKITINLWLATNQQTGAL